MRISKQFNKRRFIMMLIFRTPKLHWKLTNYYQKQIPASQKKVAMGKWKWPSREAFKGRTNSVNSVSSRLLKTSSAVIICLFDSLQMSLALHIHKTPTTIQLLVSQKVPFLKSYMNQSSNPLQNFPNCYQNTNHTFPYFFLISQAEEKTSDRELKFSTLGAIHLCAN